MNRVSKIIAIHIGLQLLYTAIFTAEFLGTSDAYRGLGFMIMMVIALLVHAALGLLIALVIRLSQADTDQRQELIKGHLLGICLACVIGGSVCFAAPAML